MNQTEIENIKTLVLRTIGVSVNGSMGKIKPRTGLSFWFSDYNRGNGPVFSIRPLGLKRHLVTLKFGPYASVCVEHILLNASDEAYETAYALIERLASNSEVLIDGNAALTHWKVSSEFVIEANRKVENQKSTQCIIETVEKLIIPMMAAMAELIGYEEIEPDNELAETETEGNISYALVKKRERSPRNRFLCLSIHGNKCSVCGYQPNNVYDPSIASIIEVHHIEPLSEVDAEKKYDPRTELIPLCPNCHRAIHKRKPAFKPEELKELLIE